MLCLSGFELYCRWVPLFTADFKRKTWFAVENIPKEEQG